MAYDFSELDELVHAYAVSVHKSQGSEYPAVVFPVLTQHYILLQRNLIYTARHTRQAAGRHRGHAQSARDRGQERANGPPLHAALRAT
ncbi:MAG: ATP-binding domain-containing protein [Desulfosudis oleivorans]|nr:ATP-binding domain-containing protein [Desulfosudis oleivorans]